MWVKKRGSLGKRYTSGKNRNPWVLLWGLTIRDRKSAISIGYVTWASAEALNENWCRSLQGAIEPRWYIKSFCLSRFNKVLWWDYRAQGQGWRWNSHWCGACTSSLEKRNWTRMLNGRSRQTDGRRSFTFRKQNSYLSDINRGRDFINSSIAYQRRARTISLKTFSSITSLQLTVIHRLAYVCSDRWVWSPHIQVSFYRNPRVKDKGSGLWVWRLWGWRGLCLVLIRPQNGAGACI